MRWSLRRFVLGRLDRIIDSRPPDFVIGPSEQPYLRRWWVLPRNPIFNIYFHEFLASDDDRALHDHPWANISWVLAGHYIEARFLGRPDAGLPLPQVEFVTRRPGSVVARRPSSAHRIVLPERRDGSRTPVYTLFVTGPVVRRWGFWCPDDNAARWVPWQTFVDARDKGRVGIGCGE